MSNIVVIGTAVVTKYAHTPHQGVGVTLPKPGHIVNINF